MSYADIEVIVAGLLDEDEFGSKEMDENERRQNANQWIQGRVYALKDWLCSSAGVKAARKSGNGALLFAEILDVVVQHATQTNVPATVIAAGILLLGLDNICGQPTSQSRDAAE